MKKITYNIILSSLIVVSAAYAVPFKTHEAHQHIHINNKSSNVAADAVVHLNSAVAASLVRLKGIGKKRAKNIITYRNLHGPFHKIDDLGLVPGLNKKFIARLVKKNENIKILL